MNTIPNQNPLETRWVFTDALTEHEKKVHAHFCQMIDKWWNAFVDNAKNIDAVFTRQGEFDIVGFMSENLNIISRDISWEFGAAVKGEGHRLVITPESFKELRPLVNEILKRAPKIEGWEFYGYRLPESFNHAVENVKARTGGDITDLKFQVAVNDLSQVDLFFIKESCQSDDDLNQAFNDAFVAIESLLGEADLDKWIGAIEVDNKPKDSSEEFPIDQLGDIFIKKLHEIKYYQLEEPHYKLSQTASWSMVKLKPEESDDYPQQKDIFVSKTMNQPMWQSFHSGNLFYSERFSKFGEIFCYIKIDGSKGLGGKKFEDKGDIEDAVDKVLIENEAGCFIGGGTGLKYSYIDLALTDVEKGIKLIKELLQEGEINKNAWIQFFDSELEFEWVGIWDDSPKPPLPVLE